MNKQEYAFNYRVWRKMGKISDGTFKKVLRMQGVDDRVVEHFDGLRGFGGLMGFDGSKGYKWISEDRRCRIAMRKAMIKQKKMERDARSHRYKTGY